MSQSQFKVENVRLLDGPTILQTVKVNMALCDVTFPESLERHIPPTEEPQGDVTQCRMLFQLSDVDHSVAMFLAPKDVVALQDRLEALLAAWENQAIKAGGEPDIDVRMLGLVASSSSGNHGGTNG